MWNWPNHPKFVTQARIHLWDYGFLMIGHDTCRMGGGGECVQSQILKKN